MTPSVEVKINKHSLCFRKTKKRRFGQQHVGGNLDPRNPSKFYWAVQPPNSADPRNAIFLDKCLLLCTIFGLLQNDYFYSNRKNKKFLYVQGIHSKFENKRKHAFDILSRELSQLFSVTKLLTNGPYQLQATVEILHQSYKCQFFVFSGYTGKKKLSFMYPLEYDDTLIPIYLYQSAFDTGHIIFIKNLNSYFRANYIICFQCKRQFSSFGFRHMCSKRPCCFACRRFYQTKDSYVHEKLFNQFCNKFVTLEKAELCNLCNVTVYSQHCLKGHRKLCNGQGHFGFKCLKCNRFKYASKDSTSNSMKANHACEDSAICRYCFKPKENQHLCKLKDIPYPNFHNRLGFFTIEFDESDENHSSIFLALFYVEEESRGNFKKYVITDPNYRFNNNDEDFFVNYFTPNTENTSFELFKQQKNKKVSDDFKRNLKKVTEGSQNLCSRLISFILSRSNTTYICQDTDGKMMVN